MFSRQGTTNIDFQNRRNLWWAQLDEIYHFLAEKTFWISIHEDLDLIQIRRVLHCDAL